MQNVRDPRACYIINCFCIARNKTITVGTITALVTTHSYGSVLRYAKIVVYDTTNRTDSTTHFFMGRSGRKRSAIRPRDSELLRHAKGRLQAGSAESWRVGRRSEAADDPPGRAGGMCGVRWLAVTKWLEND